MKKKNSKNLVVTIVLAVIAFLILLTLGTVSLVKVNNVKNNSIPEVLDEINDSKNNTSTLIKKVNGKIDSLEEGVDADLAKIMEQQENYYNSTNWNINSKYNALVELNNKNYNRDK